MKTIVFMTGATGTMGWAGMQEILRYPERYGLRVLARPSQKNKVKLAPYMDRLEVIWGDLTCYEDVLRGVTGSDVVLHVGGMVSPQADYRPQATRRTNMAAATYVRDAVLAQPEERQPKVIYIGSVAQIGDRREPYHWARTGDPLCVSPYDHYGLTKAMGEWVITNSPIRRWVSLRQSGILHPGILNHFDPIMFHVPIHGVLEWATVEDSGRVLERVCRDDVPETFWRRYYNISSGAEYRINNYEFECLLLDAIGCPKPEQIFEPKWFATRNFHGAWYTDSDVLEEYLHFRAHVPLKDYFTALSRSRDLPMGIRLAGMTRIAKLVPHVVKAVMYRTALTPEHGTQWWIKNRRLQRIRAYYGNEAAYQAIPDWSGIDVTHNSEQVLMLNHGYDETKPMERFTIVDMQQAAAWRGGRCLSTTMQEGDWDTPLEWECAEGHRFEATPRVVLLGGHWCPQCMPWPYEDEAQARPWQWDRQAKQNPFLGQLWLALHDANDDNVYEPNIYSGWER